MPAVFWGSLFAWLPVRWVMICGVFWCLSTFLILERNTPLQLHGAMLFRNDICHLASRSQILHCWLALWCRSAVAHCINVTATFFSFPKHLVCVNWSAVEISVLWGLSLSLPSYPRQSRHAECFTEWRRNWGPFSECCYPAQDHSTTWSECTWDISSWPFTWFCGGSSP